MAKSCSYNKTNELAILGVGVGLFAGYKLFKFLRRKNKLKTLKGKTVVITGASTGIGKAYAYAFAKAGSNIVLAARSTDKIEELAEDLKTKFNIEVLAITTDVSDQNSAENMIVKTLEHFNNIDILINNAGLGSHSYFHEENMETMKKMIDVNFWGMVYCTKAVLPSMIKRGQGKIINVSSVVGKRAMPLMGMYSASKFAMEGLSESIRVELNKYGIDIIVICPTSTKTEFFENSNANDSIKRFANFGMTAEKVAKETINAVLDNKREHILGIGSNLALSVNDACPHIVDKVLTLAPKFMMQDV